jgi:hypothetical protein
MPDGDKMWGKAIDAARESPPLQYQEVYRACVDGQIKAEKRGGQWWVWRPDVELLALKWAAMRDGVLTSKEFDAIASGASTALESLRDNLTRWSKLLVQTELVDRTMEGDQAEATAKGNLDLAAAIQEARDHMRAARVHWDGEARAWKLTVPGVGSAHTTPVTKVPA